MAVCSRTRTSTTGSSEPCAYLGTTSPLFRTPRWPRPVRLTTTWSLFILFSLVSAAGVTTRASQVEAQSPQTDPTPYFSINWTVLATGHSDSTSGSGTRTVRDRTIRMSGFTVTRKYANGAWDDLPYDLIVNDDFHDVQTSPCPGGGLGRPSISTSVPACGPANGR